MSTKRLFSVTSLDLSECDICLEEPDDPRLLPCAHVFCLSCLEKEHRQGTKDGLFKSRQVRCPYCNKMSDVPPGGLRNLDKDRMSLEVGALVKERKGDKKHQEPKRDTTKKTTSADAHIHTMLKNDKKQAKTHLQKMCKSERQAAVEEVINGHSLLTSAISENALEFMIYLLEECEADVEQQTDATLTLSDEALTTSFSPLLYAAFYDNIDAAEVLIQHGADPNNANEEGITPLYIASERNALEMVKFLLDSGADVDAQDDLQVTSLMNARENPDVRALLLSKGADVNISNTDGFTALHYAASEGCIESVKVLIQYRADHSKQNKFGNTPLHDAVYKGHMDIVRLLLMQGTDPNVTNAYGNTSLHFGVYKGKKAIVQLLLNQGADPYVRNNNKEDCFLKAVLECKTDILQLLTNKHVESCYKTERGNR